MGYSENMTFHHEECPLMTTLFKVRAMLLCSNYHNSMGGGASSEASSFVMTSPKIGPSSVYNRMRVFWAGTVTVALYDKGYSALLS